MLAYVMPSLTFVRLLAANPDLTSRGAVEEVGTLQLFGEIVDNVRRVVCECVRACSARSIVSHARLMPICRTERLVGHGTRQSYF
jgi:hypothetical protein